MRGIGVHVCEGCGGVFDTVGAYLNCAESHGPPHSFEPDPDEWEEGCLTCGASDLDPIHGDTA